MKVLSRKEFTMYSDFIAKSCKLRGIEIDIPKIDGLFELRRMLTELYLKAKNDKKENENNHTISRKFAAIEKHLEKKLNEIEQDLIIIFSKIPNILEKEIEIESTQIKEKKVNHETLNTFRKQLDLDWNNIYDTSLTTDEGRFGSGLYTLLHDGIKLREKLLTDIREILYNKGFIELDLPYLVSSKTLENCGLLPKFQESLFKLENSDRYLIPTAEVSLLAYLSNRNFSKTQKFCSYSKCFRNEKIGYGKRNSSILRLFQFSKMEMFSICSINEAKSILNEFVSTVTEFLDILGLGYRVIRNSAVDTSFQASITFDIEVFFTTLQEYIEVSSCSSTSSFQSRFANIKINDEDAILLNGSFMPIERLIAGILDYFGLLQ